MSCNAGSNHNFTYDALHDGEHRKHQIKPPSDRRLCKHEAYKYLQCLLGAFEFLKAIELTHYPHKEEQYEKRVADGFERTVDIHHHVPYTATFEGFGRLGYEPPYFSELAVPSVKGVFKVFYNPIVRHLLTSLSLTVSP